MMTRTIRLTTVLIWAALTASGQAKKPTLMILPSDNWCNQRYFLTDFSNQGVKQKVADYKMAFQEDAELGQVISKIGSLMVDRGFPLKDAEQEIKAIEARTAEDNMSASSTSGAGIAESPLDKLKSHSKSDIILQVWWKINKMPEGKSVSFTLEAFDAYTSKRIAAATGTGSPSATMIVPVLLQKAVQASIKEFAAQLQAHFDDMTANGREVILTLKRWDNWDKNLETEFNGEELNEYISKWVRENAVKGRFSTSGASENKVSYEQVRIPLYDKNGVAIDARQFARGLQKYLKAAPFGIDAKLMTRGLGEAILVLGEK